MSLFTVNRYLGDSSPQPSEQSAQTILDRLNARARSREKQRLSDAATPKTAPHSKEKRKKPPEIDSHNVSPEKARNNATKDFFTATDRPDTKSSKKSLKRKAKDGEGVQALSLSKKKGKVLKGDTSTGSKEVPCPSDDKKEVMSVKEDANVEKSSTHSLRTSGADTSMKKKDKMRKKMKKRKDLSVAADSNSMTASTQEISELTRTLQGSGTKMHGGGNENEEGKSDVGNEVEMASDDNAERIKNEEDKDVEDEDVSCSESDAVDDNEGTGFPVLGEYERRNQKRKVRESLPHWLANPLVIERNLAENSVNVIEVEGLDKRLVSTLSSLKIEKLFPVQHHVIPVILETLKYGLHAGCAGFRPRDVCVSAPTGSGKTLAYAIPIVQALLDRVVPQVRALIVLPTRDLATQVHKVMASLCQNTSLKSVLIGGTKTFAHEQSLLVKESDGELRSAADIVVATPGRLVDNLNQTPGFSLKHLRFLVIDEADRMMDHISQDWIAQVEKSAYGGDTPASHNGTIHSRHAGHREQPGPLTVKRSSLHQLPLQKLLFSATLSQNPEKLTQLRLFQPRLITTREGSGLRPLHGPPGNQQGAGTGVEDTEVSDGKEEFAEGEADFVGKYTTPVGLSEYFIQCTAGDKPLVLCHLLLHLYFKQVLCFTNTVEATHSLVCSDAMARGMDVENVKCVISYDLPPHLRTYIHRVGRTARAGRGGTAFSFVRKKEVTKFKQMMRNAGKENIKRHQVSADHLESLVPSFTSALSELPSLLKEEKAQQY
ncbi:ATP-dependent RNA helicase DDX51-like isoform X2 [Diadema setosum]|uniref:ATP-dependent RNA helicase DDX51-like isoform X2 n=1 Tax=Diadema setosum TaxID=31175 RepID=UPI003B3AC620